QGGTTYLLHPKLKVEPAGAGGGKARKDEALTGTWAVVSVKAPESAASAAAGFKGAELTFSFDARTRTSMLTIRKGKEDGGEYRYEVHAGEGLPAIDLISDLVGEGGLRREKMAAQQGVYRVDGEELTVCLAEGSVWFGRDDRATPAKAARPARLDADPGI